MTASNDPIREVAEILRRHIGQETLQKIANELLEVRGNKTYREIIRRLADELYQVPLIRTAVPSRAIRST
jgi:hypothetical protein